MKRSILGAICLIGFSVSASAQISDQVDKVSRRVDDVTNTVDGVSSTVSKVKDLFGFGKKTRTNTRTRTAASTSDETSYEDVSIDGPVIASTNKSLVIEGDASISSDLDGYEFTVVSATGDRAAQQVEIAMIVSHNLANQEVSLYWGKAYDAEGRSYVISSGAANYSYLSQYVPSDQPVRFVFKVRGIKPSVSKLTSLTMKCNVKGVNNRDSKQIVLKNIPTNF